MTSDNPETPGNPETSGNSETPENPEYEFLDPPQGEGEIGRLGPYIVLGLLGRGGMGEVFQAHDTRLKRDVAVKCMKKKFAATPNRRKRFVEEARSMAAVDHDNVATIFEVGIHRGMPFMAMEMLRGQPLDIPIKAKKRFDYQDVVRLAAEVARGLAAAHQCGIIHRDIKPANIWIEEPSGRAKILDFGLAIAGTSVDRFSTRSSVVGSPGYLAPEQARNERVDDRTDLYSLGVVLYQMCAGKLPLVSDTMSGQLIAIITHQPAPLHEQNPDVPLPLSKLIHQLLSKEPRHRPTSALRLGQLIDEVALECESESQSALQIITDDPTEKLSKPTSKVAGARRSKSKSLLPWAISACVLVIVTGFACWFSQPKKVASEPVPLATETRQKSVKRVTDESLEPLELTAVTAGTRSAISGDAARFKMRITNNASDPANDPKQINATAKVAAQIVTFLHQKGDSKRSRPTFPKRISATQLPPPGQSKEVEILFVTSDLMPADFQVVFELQSPAGTVISTTATTLTVEENLREGELLGFELLRSHAGRGADTYVRSGSAADFGGKSVLQALRKVDQKGAQQKSGGQTGLVQEHIYLRFDLSKSPVPKGELDRAVLLLTVQQGGDKSTSTLDAYGILEGLDHDWSESGDGHLSWADAPCRDGIDRQQYLGQVTMDNGKDNLKDTADGVRLLGAGLDDFIRSAPSDLVSIVLIRENGSNQPTQFKSKEGKPNQAPALALRPRPSAH